MTPDDYFKIETKLRDVVHEILNPVYVKLLAVETGMETLKVNTARQKQYVSDTCDWVKSRGDANKVEEALSKRLNDMERQSEVCHNVLEKRIGSVTLGFD